MPEARQHFQDNQPEIFVNREGLLQTVDEAVATVPSDGLRLLVLHGLGGQGKSALCRHVYRRLMMQCLTPLNIARVDLHGKALLDPIMLLIWIRNEWAASGIDFPSFDLALALAWDAGRPEQPFPKLTNAWLARSSEVLTQAAPDAITSIREMVEKSVETFPLLGPLANWSSKWVIDKAKLTWVRHVRSYLDCLYEPDGRLRQSHELEARLHWILAQDLNHHIKADPDRRLVLLIDEYEGVFDQGGAGKQWEEIPFDQTLRRVLSETNALLTIFFTREPLPWTKQANWQEELTGNQHSLAGLEPDDARCWVSAAGVGDTNIQEAIVNGARESDEADATVYPLLLELQIEHWRLVSQTGKPVQAEQFLTTEPTFAGRCQQLMGRVLRDYGDPMQQVIEELSVASRFDQPAFAHVIQSNGIALSATAFDRISQLSLFSITDDGFITMHRALADIVAQSRGPSVGNAQ